LPCVYESRSVSGQIYVPAALPAEKTPVNKDGLIEHQSHCGCDAQNKNISELRMLRCAGYVPRMEEIRNYYTILMVKHL
jgi:hypothetical protein